MGVAVDVLEPVPSEVTEGHTRQRAVRLGHQAPRRLRRHDLPSMGGGPDARSQVHVLAEITLAVPLRFAGVQSHPHPQLLAPRPRVGL